jgi:hypothetical protein
MSIGEQWRVLDKRRNAWRLAKVINELGHRVELQFQDAPDEPDLIRTISATREEMQDCTLFRIPEMPHQYMRIRWWPKEGAA